MVNDTKIKEKVLKFDAIIERQEVQEKDGSKWLILEGTALETGYSKNKVNYRIQNLQENNNKEYNFIVAHRQDYDNPDHNVGEGKYKHIESKLRFTGKIKNTTSHPDIIEQVMDGLVSVSIQGGYERIDLEKDKKGNVTGAVVEGLKIPILALVNKHARGVEGATIESAIAERIEMEQTDIHEVNKMAEETVFEKQIKEKDELIVKAKDLMEAQAIKLKETEEKLKTIEEANTAKQLKEKSDLVKRICEMNKEFKSEELIEKSEAELKIIESYEAKQVIETEENGAGVTEHFNLPKDSNDGMIVDRYGDLTLTEEAWTKFNSEIKERVLGKD